MTPKAKQALSSARVVLVSACLLGERCRYDGKDQLKPTLLDLLRDKEIVPICPEAGAGLGIPRPPAQLHGGLGRDVLLGRARVLVKETNADVTQAYERGAALAVSAAKRFGATVAILKERSPSCGSSSVWVDGQLTPGEGVTAAALRREGILVLSDEQLLG